MNVGTVESINHQPVASPVFFTEQGSTDHDSPDQVGDDFALELDGVDAWEPALKPEVGGARASGSMAASDALIVEHLPTVRYVARRIHAGLPQHVDFEELVSAGILGLMDAVAKFKDDRNTQFKTYAQFRIRGAILDSLRSSDWSPRELRRKGRSVEEALRSSTQRLGRAPSDIEVAAEMSLTLQAYQALLTDLKGLEIGSLNVERNEGSGEEELAYVAAPAEEDPLFRCLKGEMKQHLADAIDSLPERERMVLTLYFYEELSMKEIANLLGVVESRVSQIKSSAVLRMRTAMGGCAVTATSSAKKLRAA